MKKDLFRSLFMIAIKSIRLTIVQLKFSFELFHSINNYNSADNY